MRLYLSLNILNFQAICLNHLDLLHCFKIQSSTTHVFVLLLKDGIKTEKFSKLSIDFLMPYVLILYYSRHGAVAKMANTIQLGVE